MSRLAPPPLELPFDFAPALPGSKSFAHRALILAALAAGEGPTRLTGITRNDDVEASLRGLAALGWTIAPDPAAPGDATRLAVLPRDERVCEGTLDCGLSGASARLLAALAAATPGRWRITGAPRLLERPFAELFDALRGLGAGVPVAARGLPVTIEGRRLAGGRARLDASRSSQFLSALLLIAPACEGGLEIEVAGPLASAPYAELTADLLARFGIAVERDGASWRVAPAPLRPPGSLAVEGDWSAAGGWLVLERLAASRARLPGLDPASRQPDARLPALLARLAEPGDLELDVGGVPDQTMNLAVAAAARHGATRFAGAHHLRHKESDRLAVLARELAKAGVVVAADPRRGTLVVEGRAQLRAARLDCAGDHRMAIAFSLLALLHPGIELDGAETVGKSDPRWFEQLAAARASPRCIALVGLRGAGKSALARALAARLALEAVDADAEFERRHGPLAPFVAAQGWPRFRELEEALLPGLLAPRRVVALGGGAIESAANRARLRAEAIVVHVDEELATLRARLAAHPRPSLTGADPVAELAAVAARRAPWLAEVATFALAPGRTLEARAAECEQSLRRLARW